MKIKLKIALLYILICQLINAQFNDLDPASVIKDKVSSIAEGSRLLGGTNTKAENFSKCLRVFLPNNLTVYSIKRLLNNKNPILTPKFQFPFG